MQHALQEQQKVNEEARLSFLRATLSMNIAHLHEAEMAQRTFRAEYEARMKQYCAPATERVPRTAQPQNALGEIYAARRVRHVSRHEQSAHDVFEHRVDELKLRIQTLKEEHDHLRALEPEPGRF